VKIEIIAEIGQNHNGDIELAKELIHAAKESGADVAKFQLYDAEKLFEKENNEWYGYNCKTELSKDDVDELYEECNKYGIEFMASVFDVERINWIESYQNMSRFKLASRSINDGVLIKALSNSTKDLIVSLGMWPHDDFPVIETDNKIDFLYCVSQYPTELSMLGFSKIDFKKYAGFSDHTIGVSAAEIAIARGARIIEKHFTLDKKMFGPDHQGSMMPIELIEISKFRDDFIRSH